MSWSDYMAAMGFVLGLVAILLAFKWRHFLNWPRVIPLGGAVAVTCAIIALGLHACHH